MGRLLGGSYELLLGRRTYEILAAYWPHKATSRSVRHAPRASRTSNTGQIAPILAVPAA
jgi:dihydrofolate reductase